MNGLRIGLVGARGYVGAELIRLVAAHPRFELAYVTSRERAGQPLAAHVEGYSGGLQYTSPAYEDLPELGADAAVAVALEDLGDGADLHDELGIGRLLPWCRVEGRAWQSHQRAPPLDGEAAGPAITDVGPLLGDRAFF